MTKLVFGAEIGIAPGGVPVYSSDYDTVDPKLLPTRQDYRNYHDGIYTGYKWQCVEFARRWLLINKGYVFEDIAMAYDIFRLPHVKCVSSNEKLPLKAFENGALRRPEPGCMLIWKEGGEFERTGHVAIVTEVFDNALRIAEQNLNHEKWHEGADYSRELPVSIDSDGSYWVNCTFDDTDILGWVIQTDDAEGAVGIESIDQRLLQIQIQFADFKPSRKGWLNIAKPDEAAYVAHNGHSLCAIEDRDNQYLVISKTAEKELKRATNELHALFMRATDYVMTTESLWPHFNIPNELWPRIKQSWSNRRNQMVTGRFDFALTDAGLKVYEYNCDSASCHMEAGRVQGLWSQFYHCEEGNDAGEKLFDSLVEAWREVDVDGLIHLLLDHQDAEELYHALFMREAIERAGLKTQMISGFEQTHWSTNGEVLDENERPIHWVWKTWAWETALDQLRDEINSGSHLKDDIQSIPRLMDVLFQPETMVFEPLWTLIPSNKAILPILWDMAPEYPYLLESHFELTPSLKDNGYVAKPIVGRCGHNISMVDNNAEVVSETAGKFDSQNTIYQALYSLPKVDDLHVQICSFSVAGSYAGSCARVDESLIITGKSNLMPLRVFSDKQFLSLFDH